MPLAEIVMRKHKMREMMIRLHLITTDTNQSPFVLPDSNYPDGRHTDNSRAVVSAFVTAFEGTGGESRVFSDAETCLYAATLRVGEGILQDDQKLLHGVTPVTGKRTIIGLDFDPEEQL